MKRMTIDFLFKFLRATKKKHEIKEKDSHSSSLRQRRHTQMQQNAAKRARA
jgi:hypothetical protein